MAVLQCVICKTHRLQVNVAAECWEVGVPASELSTCPGDHVVAPASPDFLHALVK
uniref:Uncharacterized protein n=1 Tax=Candidatus Kentrum sp. FW TaxID=2126338 RepID=A0A450STB8_9GAMM|nr:MAG: hypothetical protein BECKFW1821B_GA0114236_103321 [Candidatus Kentron sp. FW]